MKTGHTIGFGALALAGLASAALGGPSLVSVGMGITDLSADGQAVTGLIYDAQAQIYRNTIYRRGVGVSFAPGAVIKAGGLLGSDDFSILGMTAENSANWGSLNCFQGNTTPDHAPPCFNTYLPHRYAGGVWTGCGSFARTQENHVYADYPGGLNVWVGGTRCDASTVTANDMSGDGNIMVGGGYYAFATPRSNGNAPSGICGSFLAYSYDARTGVTTALPAQPTTSTNITTRADRTNFDGTVIVGYDLGTTPDPDGAGPLQGYIGRRFTVWRNGVEYLLDQFGNQDSAPVNRNGTIVAGMMSETQAQVSGFPADATLAGILCKWTWSGTAWSPANLGLPVPWDNGTALIPCVGASAFAISDDGNTIVGTAYYNTSPSTSPLAGAIGRSFLWRSSINGGVPIDLETYYKSLLPTGDTTLTDCAITGGNWVSADGNVIGVAIEDSRNPCLFTRANALMNLGDSPCEPVRISLNPLSQVVGSINYYGVIFNVFASGTWPVNYQWQKESSPGVWTDLADDHCDDINSTLFDVKGAVGPQLRLGTFSGNPWGTYRCVVTNSCGSVATDPATVSCGAPVVYAPTGSILCAGGSIVLHANTTAISGVAFQWYLNGVAITDGFTPHGSFIQGATTQDITIANVQAQDAGPYTFTGDNGCSAPVMSAPGTLTVTNSPPITSQPIDLYARAGETKYFQVGIGNPNLLGFTFQWRKNGVALTDGPTGTGSSITGATSGGFYGSYMYVHDITPGDSGAYDCVISGGGCAGPSTSTAGNLVFVCPADLDNGAGAGQPDGAVTIDDLLYFLAVYEQGNVRADLDDGTGTGTTDGAVTIDDLLFFLARYEGGC